MTRFTNESTPNHDSFDDGDRTSSREDMLDQSLDALIHGAPDALDDLDPGIRAAVTQIYQWADLAGVGQKETVRPTPTSATRAVPTNAAPVTSIERAITRQKRRTSPGRILMSTLSALAAALILGLGIYGAVPIFTDRDTGPTEIAFQAADDGTPEAVPGTPNVPADVIYSGNTPITDGGNVSFIPPQGTVLTGVDGSDVRYPLSPSECTVEPITREQAVSILSSAPVSDDGPMTMDSNSVVEESSLTNLQAMFREWQACRRFGFTYQAMSLESSQFIWNDIYGTGGYLNGRAALDTPLSEATVNELLDVREAEDAKRREIGVVRAANNPGWEDGLLMHMWFIDTNQMLPGGTPGTYTAGTDNWIQVPTVIFNPLASGGPLETIYIGYVKGDDGQWKMSEVLDNGQFPSIDSDGNRAG